MLLSDMLGVISDQLAGLRVRLVDSPPAPWPGAMADVVWPLDLPNSPLRFISLFLLHAPVPTSPHRFELRACVTDSSAADVQAFDFLLGHVGILVRPSFRDPQLEDADPFYRQVVEFPDFMSPEPIRRNFSYLYSALIDVAVGLRSRNPAVDRGPMRSWAAHRLVRLYQTRSLVNAFVVGRPWSGLSAPCSPAAYRLPFILSGGRLAGWENLPVDRLGPLLELLWPSVGVPYDIITTDDVGGFYGRLGWLGPPLSNPPPGVEDSWLYAPPAPTPTPASERTPADVINWNSLYDEQLMEMLGSMSIPAALFPPRSSEPPSPPPPPPPPPRFFQDDDELDLPAEPQEILGPPLPEYQSMEVTPVPEGMFETVSAVLSRVLEGQAVVAPLVRFVLTSETGRTLILTPTYPAPVLAEATPFRGLALEDS